MRVKCMMCGPPHMNYGLGRKREGEVKSAREVRNALDGVVPGDPESCERRERACLFVKTLFPKFRTFLMPSRLIYERATYRDLYNAPHMDSMQICLSHNSFSRQPFVTFSARKAITVTDKCVTTLSPLH